MRNKDVVAAMGLEPICSRALRSKHSAFAYFATRPKTKPIINPQYLTRYTLALTCFRDQPEPLRTFWLLLRAEL